MLARIERDGVEDVVAVEEPLEIRVDGAAAGGDDANAGPRRGAGARLPARRGADRPAARGRPERRPGRKHGRGQRARCSREPGDAQLLRDLLLRGLRQGRDRGGHGPQRAARAGARVVARALLASCPSGCASPPSSAAAACTRPGASTPPGSSLCAREDVGRHNAMDKVIGRALLDGAVPLAGRHPVRQRPPLLRAGAEGGRCRLPDPRRRRARRVHSRSSSPRAGVTLCGFAREGRLNVYSHSQRVED